MKCMQFIVSNDLLDKILYFTHGTLTRRNIKPRLIEKLSDNRKKKKKKKTSGHILNIFLK
jgi:hypothetical protein